MVSIIVPLYKVEEYACECIDSILNQSYSDIQVILVDDGSPDSCGRIIDDYEKNDARVIAVHKKNGGLSSARNEGLIYAKGEFVSFVDGDDILHVDMIKTLIELIIEYNADIASCDFGTVEEENKKSQHYHTEVFSSQKALSEMFKRKSLGWSACNKLYKKSLFEGITYPIGLYCEDKATTYKLIYKADTVIYTNQKLYLYRLRNGSITTTKSKKFYQDTLMINNEMILFFCNNNNKEMENRAKVYSAKNAALIYSQICDDNDYFDIAQQCLGTIQQNYATAKKDKLGSKIWRYLLICIGKGVRMPKPGFPLICFSKCISATKKIRTRMGVRW